MNVNPDVILIYPLTHATIPDRFVRETDLDNKYIKGSDDGTLGYGGNTTHSHNTTANHGHTLNAHSHSVTIGAGTGGADETGSGADGSIVVAHNHSGGTTTGTTGGSLSSVSGVYASVSNDPPYKTVIFIKSLGSYFVPDDVCGFWDSATLPNGFSFCNGSNGTPDYRNLFLKGANTDANAGSTGGSLYNSHTLTHTHSVSSHGHSGGTTGSATGTQQDSKTGSELQPYSHTHTWSVNDATDTITSSDPVLSCTEEVQPLYKKLALIQNTSGDVIEPPIGFIGVYRGTEATIPVGWTRYTDMDGYYVKICNTLDEIGNTGGSNTHSHSNDTHTHSGSHNHGANNLTHSSSLGTDGGGVYSASSTTSHSVSVSTQSTTYSTETTSSDSASNEPEYEEVFFIKKIANINGGAYLLKLI